MKLKQSRIQTLKHLSFLKPNDTFKISVYDISRFPQKIKDFGFSTELKHGEKILPNTLNKYSKQNAEQYFTINKNLPKEKYYQTVYWTRNEFIGPNQTREVTGFTDTERERYHRDVHLPFSVEFILIDKKGIKSIFSDELIYCEKNYNKILNTINMILSLFGECTIVSDNIMRQPTNIIHLSWDILPTGNCPWDKMKNNILDISSGRKKTYKQMMLRNCELINTYKPDFTAYGRAGFKGYAIFGFTDKNLYILESVIPNNATYIFESNWETLSKLSKAEILSEHLHKCRIIHNANWEREFRKLIEVYNG